MGAYACGLVGSCEFKRAADPKPVVYWDPESLHVQCNDTASCVIQGGCYNADYEVIHAALDEVILKYRESTVYIISPKYEGVLTYEDGCSEEHSFVMDLALEFEIKRVVRDIQNFLRQASGNVAVQHIKRSTIQAVEI